MLSTRPAAVCDEHSSTIICRRQEAGSYQARAAGPPSLASKFPSNSASSSSCLLTYKALHGLAPSYITNLCRPVTTVGSRQRLRSATRGDVVVSYSITHFGTHAFAVAGPKAWNQLPMHMRARKSVGLFKTAPKSHFHSVD